MIMFSIILATMLSAALAINGKDIFIKVQIIYVA